MFHEMETKEKTEITERSFFFRHLFCFRRAPSLVVKCEPEWRKRRRKWKNEPIRWLFFQSLYENVWHKNMALGINFCFLLVVHTWTQASPLRAQSTCPNLHRCTHTGSRPPCNPRWPSHPPFVWTNFHCGCNGMVIIIIEIIRRRRRRRRRKIMIVVIIIITIIVIILTLIVII